LSSRDRYIGRKTWVTSLEGFDSQRAYLLAPPSAGGTSGVAVAPDVPVLVSPVEPLLPAASDVPEALLGVLVPVLVSPDIVAFGAGEAQAASTKTHAKGVIHFIIESSSKD
jgi:hypothetical protein